MFITKEIIEDIVVANNIKVKDILTISNKKNLNYEEAVRLLAKRKNIFLRNPFKSSLNRLYNVNKEVSYLYNKQLSVSNFVNSIDAKEYLESRNIDAEIIKKFGLGYALDSWNSLYSWSVDNEVKLEDMILLGLVIKSDPHIFDAFRNRIIIPIFDVYNNIVGFQGRVLSNDTTPKYINSSDSIVFNKSKVLYGLNFAVEEIVKRNLVLIVEGFFDLISLYNKGIKNVIATLGTAFTPFHARLISRYTRNIITCYDADIAGTNASERTIKNCPKDFRIRKLVLPEKMDVEEFINSEKFVSIESLFDRIGGFKKEVGK